MLSRCIPLPGGLLKCGFHSTLRTATRLSNQSRQAIFLPRFRCPPQKVGRASVGPCTKGIALFNFLTRRSGNQMLAGGIF